ncbi:ParA family protein [Enterococcus rivorum]|uniref:AAA domain-containing protein n=2 Tax=Enterococcus rivorum TaxID=762845 RepID=A0A1E5L0K1_9ENTE|nr:ParA family protein [Enterococcus rivorum]MBP2098889.1 cellulose biosynthesis protein BcsQ [Enterococcus rivorum]OEH83615.1 hypothetical protein BCR26_09055 [Enterococcus rivorum]
MAIRVEFLQQDSELVALIKKLVTMRRAPIKIVIANWKGGVSKTASTVQLANIFSMMGLKVGVVDQDAQGNTTNSLIITKQNQKEGDFAYEETLMRGIKNGDLSKVRVEINSNLYLFPSTSDFFSFPNFLDVKFGVAAEGSPNFDSLEHQKISYLPSLLDPYIQDLDILITDTPPGDSYATKSAVYGSDYIIVALQTQSDSLENAVDFIKKFVPKIYKFKQDFDILGILASMLNAPGSPLDSNGELPRKRLEVLKNTPKWTLDLEVYQDALDEFGDSELFSTIIPYMRRITSVPRRGIRLEDRWDKQILEVYYKLAIESLTRILYRESGQEYINFEKEGENVNG